MIKKHYVLLNTIFVLCFTTACTTTQVVKHNAIKANQDLTLDPDGIVLDIGIVKFDPGLPEDEGIAEDQNIIAEVRRAEGSYIAYHLKSTLENTANWGAVRVLPEPSPVVHLTINGKIISSDGERLEIHLKAYDSTGRIWIDKNYGDSASKFAYRDYSEEDPFQDLYNTISNDLLQIRLAMKPETIALISQTSSLLFAAELSPDAFSDYIESSPRGSVKIKQLPSQDDPMMQRVDQIKEREYLFIDTLDEFYSKFYRDMNLTYYDFREYTYTEGIRLREMKKQARNRLIGGALLIAGSIAAGQSSNSSAASTAAVGGVVGGIGILKTGIDRLRESEIHEEAIKELSASLAGEMTPITLDIEGRTFELKGSIDAQYVQWKQLLHEIYNQEIGDLTKSDLSKSN